MATAHYTVAMDGYYRDQFAGNTPAISGVYCVYECKYNPDSKTVSLLKLLYIGESANIHDRIVNHEKKPIWRKHVRPGNELCYAWGPVIEANRFRVEAAMINHHKPPCNTEYLNDFPFDTTTITITGQVGLLTPNFTVYGTALGYSFGYGRR